MHLLIIKIYLQTVDHSNNCTKESWPAHAAEQGKHGHYNIVVWPWHITIAEVVRTELCLNDLPSKIQ